MFDIEGFGTGKRDEPVIEPVEEIPTAPVGIPIPEIVEEPVFFDLDEQIRKVTESVDLIPGEITALSLKHREMLDELQRKIARENELYYKKLQELEDMKRKSILELAALKEQRKREQESRVFAETAKVVKEICADFASWHKARMYQAEDIISIVHQYIVGESGVMNANEMALGKTFESIVALYIIRILFEREHKRKARILWLTKAAIVETDSTRKEFARWDPTMKVAPIKGKDTPAMREFVCELAEDGEMMIITNYEVMRTTPKAQGIVWDIVIMDEVHKLKGGANASGPTAIWEAVRDGVSSSRFIMMLTGTPLVNKMEEMWSYLHIFDSEAFPDVKRFTRQFQAYKSVAGQLQLTVSSDKLLKQALRGRLIRRTATEVGLELPELITQDTMLQHNPEQYKIYKKMRDDFFIWLEKQEKALTAASILAQVTRLRQINVLPVANFYIKDEDGNIIETIKLDVRDSSKIDEAVDIIMAANDQCVVFSNFNEPMEELADRLRQWGFNAKIISSKYRQEMANYEEDFQQQRIDVLLLNSSMGEGLNLQKDPEKWPGGARVGIALDKWWNNARNDQCIKRIHRPGGKEAVFFYNLYVEHSIDMWINQLCDEKDAEFAAVMDSGEIRPASYWKEHLEGMF